MVKICVSCDERNMPNFRFRFLRSCDLSVIFVVGDGTQRMELILNVNVEILTKAASVDYHLYYLKML